MSSLLTPSAPSALQAYQNFEPAHLHALGFQLLNPARWSLRKSWPMPDVPKAWLTALGLGIWTNKLGGVQRWLVGSTDETLHPHERWLLFRSSKSPAWFSINHHRQRFDTVDHVQLISKEQVYFQALHGSVDPHGAWNAGVHWRSHTYRPSTGVEMRQALLSDRYTPSELHDLVFHYEAFAARAPEYTDMPADLVWRMHGLQHAREISDANRTFKLQLWAEDDAFLLPADQGC